MARIELDKSELKKLLEEKLRRRRKKTDLSQFDGNLREMMDLDISLPVILDWLISKGQITTLPALRRYVRRVFGEEFYDDFTERNGWMKRKQEKPISAESGTKPSVNKQTKPPTPEEIRGILDMKVDLSSIPPSPLPPPKTDK